MFGSGGLLLNEKGQTEFHHSPRLSVTNHIAEADLGCTSRPLVRLPFKLDMDAAPDALYRMETISGDALNFAWPIRASLVITNALTNLLELGYSGSLMRLRNPLRAAKVVGQYGDKNTIAVQTSDAAYQGVKPSDILADICELALRIDEVRGILDPESRQVLPEIIDVRDRMRNDFYSVISQVESISRLYTFRTIMEREGLALGSERMCRFDYAWDKIGGGIAERLREKKAYGWHGFKQGYSPAVMKRRIMQAPQDTRASIRGASIESDSTSNQSVWGLIDIAGVKRQFYPLATDMDDFSS